MGAKTLVLLVGIPLAAFFCYVFLRSWLITRRLRRVAADRGRLGDPGRAELFDYCSLNGLPPGMTQDVYDYLQRYISGGVEAFPIRLDDKLYSGGLWIDRGEIDTIIEDLAGICKCKVQWNLDAAPGRHPTVRDLVDLILEWRGCKPARADTVADES